jgi:hypothetical protein
MSLNFIRPAPYPPRPRAETNKDPAQSSDSLSGFGVNAHFFRPSDGAPLMSQRDLDFIQGAGFCRVRMDLLWSQVEKTPGVFNFQRYDAVIDNLLRRGIRPMVILGLGNPLYSSDGSIQSPSARVAFERYAREVVRHYQGQGLLYELVNEPNHPDFWKPTPDPKAYMAMTGELLPQLRTLDSSAHFVAPSTAGAPPDYLETCFRSGLLNWVDGVTIHPYQTYYKTPPYKRNPEAVAHEMQETRVLIDRYAPPGKHIPILLGEWGYSSIPTEVDEKTQARYMARQFLLGLLYGCPVNIWYDWKGNINGTYQLREKEDNFGLVNASPVVQAKPAYFAMRDLSRSLAGKQLVKRLSSQPDDYILQFSDRAQTTLALWTSQEPHSVIIEGKQFLLTGAPAYLTIA